MSEYRTATRVALVASLLSFTLSPALSAQEVDASGKPWVVSVSHWAKWGVLAGAVGLTALAALERKDGDQLFSELTTLCRMQSDLCSVSAEGSYLVPSTETMFQSVLDADGRAQRLLIFGQLALVTAGGMFLMDLVWDDGSGPENIPFAPLEVFSTPDRVGLRLRF